MKPTNKMLISAAVYGLVSIAVHADGAKPAAAADGKVECQGSNSCKGKGDCHGNGASCKGTNACKGKGWNSLSKADCDKAHAAAKAEPKHEEKKK